MDNQEKTSTFSDEKYIERKSEIEKSDDELVAFGKKESNAFPDATAPITWGNIRTLSLALGDRLEKYPLVDIGGGEYGFSYVVDVQEESDGDFRVHEYIDVEPFSKCKSKTLPEDIDTKLQQDKRDGLSYLLAQAEEFGNVICSSINYSLIPNDDYLKRVAQEVYRVVPEDGLFITTDSDEIREEAERLFPYSILINYQTAIFSKKPLPSDDIIQNCYTDHGRNYLRVMKNLAERLSKSGEAGETAQRRIDEVRKELSGLGFEVFDVEPKPSDFGFKKVSYKVKKKDD